MKQTTYLILVGAMALSACSAPLRGFETADPPELPEAVRTLAAPGQNIATARLRDEDGCYWYDHAGPVETTPIPLRTAEGSQICLQREA